MFPCAFCKIFKNTYFLEYLEAAASIVTVFKYVKWLFAKFHPWLLLRVPFFFFFSFAAFVGLNPSDIAFN